MPTLAREAVADAIAQLDVHLSSVLDQQSREHLAASEQSILRMQRSVANMTAEVACALGGVTDMCGLIADRLEADRLDRRMLLDAVTRLAPVSSTALEATERAIGGTIFASPEMLPPDVISLVEIEPEFAAPSESAPASAETWWGDDNPWRRPPPGPNQRVH